MPLMSEQRKSYFKPIPPDPELEKLNPNTMYYRKKQNNRLRCSMCPATATKILVRQLEGCKKIERYCDSCALKAQSINQSTSGI